MPPVAAAVRLGSREDLFAVGPRFRTSFSLVGLRSSQKPSTTSGRTRSRGSCVRREGSVAGDRWTPGRTSTGGELSHFLRQPLISSPSTLRCSPRVAVHPDGTGQLLPYVREYAVTCERRVFLSRYLPAVLLGIIVQLFFTSFNARWTSNRRRGVISFQLRFHPRETISVPVPNSLEVCCTS